MKYFLGIDLGTTNIKVGIIDQNGFYIDSEEDGYPIITPYPGWAEQDPLLWWGKTVNVINKLLQKLRLDKTQIKGIGLSGQMHGMVPIDKNGHPISNAIIWADQRVYKEIELIKNTLPPELLKDKLGNYPNSGFTLPKILWYKKHLPEFYKKTYKFLFPKDFIRMKITGDLNTDYSDASASLMFDLKEKKWSYDVFKIFNLSQEKLPQVEYSTTITGETSKEFQKLTGILPGTPVIAGAGDQPCTAIGNLVLKEGKALITVGTGGQLFFPTRGLTVDPGLRVHTLLHAIENTYYIMGAIQAAGASLKWWMDNITNQIGYSDIDNLNISQPGAKGLLFTPYLFGERTPHMDDKIRATFLGISFTHKREDFIQAIMEGVSFAIREGKEIITSLNIKPGKYLLAGGITKSKKWSNILSNILGEKLYILEGEEKASYGAALLALTGIEKKDLKEIPVKVKEEIEPDNRLQNFYNELFLIYKEIYKAQKSLNYKLFELFKKGGKI